MALSRFRQESIYRQGLWRIAWLGRLVDEPKLERYPFIRAYLGRVALGEHVGRIEGDLIDLPVPIGELPLLYINGYVRDGVVGHHEIQGWPLSWGVGRRIVVDTARSNITVFDRYHRDSGDFVIPVFDRWRSSDRERDGLFVGFNIDGDPFALCIPCVEVFRFFYATSSLIAESILMGQMLDANRYMWDAARSWIDHKEGVAFLRLRSKMVDVDARALACFAFDSYALEQANAIFLAAAGRHSDGDARLIRAIPPFEQVVEMKIMGKEIQSSERQRFLATRIVACSYIPPFRDLHFGRENDGRFDDKERDVRKPMNYGIGFNAPVKDLPPDSELRKKPSSYAAAVRKLVLQEACDRFPNLSDVPATKLPREAAEFKHDADGKLWIPPLVGDDQAVINPQTSDQLTSKVLVFAREELAALPRDRAADVDNKLDEGNRVVVELLRFISTQRLAEVTPETPLHYSSMLCDVPVSVYPYTVDERDKKWLYMDDEKRYRRMVVTARVRAQDGRIRYVVEIQHKRPKECSTLVLWNELERNLTPDQLHQALMDTAHNEGPTLTLAAKQGIRWGRRKHSIDQIDESTAKHFLALIFTTPWIRKKLKRVTSGSEYGVRYEDEEVI